MVVEAAERKTEVSLKKGDVLYLANTDDGIVEKAIVSSVHTEGGRVGSFRVDFPETGDYDEYEGSTLGKNFFTDMYLALAGLRCVRCGA